jgi:hypothetical protein
LDKIKNIALFRAKDNIYRGVTNPHPKGGGTIKYLTGTPCQLSEGEVDI